MPLNCRNAKQLRDGEGVYVCISRREWAGRGQIMKRGYDAICGVMSNYASVTRSDGWLPN